MLGHGQDVGDWPTTSSGAWAAVGGCDNIVWGIDGQGDDNIVWGMREDGDNIVWGMAQGDDNIVWGMDCDGADCDNVVWGTADSGDNIVWARPRLVTMSSGACRASTTSSGA